MSNYQIVKFRENNIEIDVNVSPSEDTVWLSLNEMCTLFDRDKSVISRHIKSVILDNNLDVNQVVAKNATTGSDGKAYMVSFYNLEVIIPVGYREHSYNGILFRRWANHILKEYLLKGYVINEKRTLITNENYVNLEVTPKKEIKMFDTEAFEQDWINACVHNKWSENNHPGIYVYSNRLEIESFGGIPKTLTKEQFLKGKSEPVNKQLFDVFRSCNFAEESGHGVPSVVSRYGEDAYVFSEYFIDVIIPFDKNGFGVTTRKNDSKQPEKIRESIIDLLSSNNRLSRKNLSLLLGVGEGSIKHHLNKLQEEKRLTRIGPDKGGYWVVLK